MDFPIYVLGRMLVTNATPFVCFTQADIANPGAFQWGDEVQLTPSDPHYGGVVIGSTTGRRGRNVCVDAERGNRSGYLGDS
jgi:hypothetical protein